MRLESRERRGRAADSPYTRILAGGAMPQRLSALDASFLDVETPSAHMHLGWAALLEPPRGRSAPSFDQMRAQIARRLAHTPRYRQRLAELPLGFGERMWVDDDRFDVSRHVIRADSSDLAEVV